GWLTAWSSPRPNNCSGNVLMRPKMIGRCSARSLKIIWAPPEIYSRGKHPVNQIVIPPFEPVLQTSNNFKHDRANQGIFANAAEAAPIRSHRNRHFAGGGINHGPAYLFPAIDHVLISKYRPVGMDRGAAAFLGKRRRHHSG